MKNTGLDYEVLVQSIFQEIHNQETANNIIVERDVKLIGKSGTTHQIDVFWQFEIGGIKYSTIVQAKDWASSVKQEQILALKSVLDDLPRQPRGIIVTRKGFQKGARKFAESHGIELFELKEISKPAPLQVQVGSFAQLHANFEEQCFEVTLYPVTYSNIKLILENGWTKTKSKEYGRRAIPESLENLPSWNDNLYDCAFEPSKSVGRILIDTMELTKEGAMFALDKNLNYHKDLSHKFESPTYFSTKSKLLPFIRIVSIDFTVQITKNEPIKTPFVKPNITSFVLKNIVSGNEKTFDLAQTDVA